MTAMASSQSWLLERPAGLASCAVLRRSLRDVFRFVIDTLRWIFYGTATKSREVNAGIATGIGTTAISSLAEPVGSSEVTSAPSVT